MFVFSIWMWLCSLASQDLGSVKKNGRVVHCGCWRLVVIGLVYDVEDCLRLGWSSNLWRLIVICLLFTWILPEGREDDLRDWSELLLVLLSHELSEFRINSICSELKIFFFIFVF
jgi:hypothetical protein